MVQTASYLINKTKEADKLAPGYIWVFLFFFSFLIKVIHYSFIAMYPFISKVMQIFDGFNEEDGSASEHLNCLTANGYR